MGWGCVIDMDGLGWVMCDWFGWGGLVVCVIGMDGFGWVYV